MIISYDKFINLKMEKSKLSKNEQIVFGLILGFIIIWFLGFFNGEPSKNNETNVKKTEKVLSLSSSQIEYLMELQSQGFIDIQAENIRVYIDPNLWNSIDSKLKEDLSLSLAIYVGNERGKNLYWVDIYDKMSGKKLAKYSKSWGFKIY